MHEYDIVMDFIRKTVYLLGTSIIQNKSCTKRNITKEDK